MTIARKLEKEDWRREVIREGRKCEAICPICKYSCIGRSGHLYDVEHADVEAHKCGKHYWLRFVTVMQQVITVSGTLPRKEN